MCFALLSHTLGCSVAIGRFSLKALMHCSRASFVVVHCMQDSILCLTAAVIISLFDEAQCTFSSVGSDLHSTFHKRHNDFKIFHVISGRRLKGEPRFSIVSPQETVEDLSTSYRAASNQECKCCHDAACCWRGSFILERSGKGKKINQMTFGKLCTEQSCDNYTPEIIISISEGKREAS